MKGLNKTISTNETVVIVNITIINEDLDKIKKNLSMVDGSIAEVKTALRFIIGIVFTEK